MRMAAQIHWERQAFTAAGAPGEDECHRVSARGVVLDGFGQRLSELRRAVIIQQGEQSSALAGNRFASLEGGLKKWPAVGDHLREPAAGSGAQSLSFFFQEGGQMSRVFHTLAPIKGSVVSGDFRGAVENPHR